MRPNHDSNNHNHNHAYRINIRHCMGIYNDKFLISARRRKGMTHAHETKAFMELKRIKPLSAFNVQGHYLKTRVNQFKVVYQFDDGSDLIILPNKSRGIAKLDLSMAIEKININK
jgi:hypothetical protein